MDIKIIKTDNSEHIYKSCDKILYTIIKDIKCFIIFSITKDVKSELTRNTSINTEIIPELNIKDIQIDNKTYLFKNS
jgi:hypothetical protein